MNEATKDLIAGTVAGCAGIVAGQPFDVVKVKMQYSSHFRSSAECFAQTFRSGGIPALYRGLLPPLIGNGPVNAVLFSTYGATLRALGDGRRGRDPALAHTALAGSVAGFAQSFVIGPSELIKCQLQVQSPTGSSQAPASPLATVRKRVSALGWRRGVFQGVGATMMRDTPSFGLYFSTFQVLKQRIASAMHKPESSSAVSFAAGGATGVAAWAVIYPLDVVKSRIQGAPVGAAAADIRWLRVARRILEREGPAAFVRGLDSTLLRAFPVNAVTLGIYDFVMSTLNP